MHSPSTRLQVLLLFAIFAFALLLRWPIADIPLERDEGEYSYIAQRWLQGEPPYKESFDQKPPGVFAAYTVFLTCIGRNPASIHWGTQLYTLGTIGMLFLLGRHLFGAQTGLLAAAFLAYALTDPSVLGNAANTETFMVLPLVGGFLAALLAVERQSWHWAFLAGVLSAAAVLCKQVAAPNVVFYGLLLVASRPRWKLTAGFILGGLVVVLLVVGYFHRAGALAEFWDCTVGHNLSYAARTPLLYYPALFLAAFSDIFLHLGPIFVLAGGGMLVPRALVPCPEELAHSRSVAWLIFSLMGVCIGGYFREHYFIQILPPVALFAARGTVALASLLPAPRLRGALAWLLAGGAIAFGLVRAPWYYLPGPAADKARELYGNNPFPESLDVGRYLAAQTAPDEPIFVFGSEPQIYFYSQRRSASRYIFAYPLMTSFADTLVRQQSVLDELRAQPPRYIVMVNLHSSFLNDNDTPTLLRDRLEDVLHQSYQLEKMPDVDTPTLTLWRRVSSFPEF
jgi:4-amino-4-deoxy-L-arabinose transferase-like glycosyltransferase